jgi:antitoxin component of MazEF toxin-antitoxin module
MEPKGITYRRQVRKNGGSMQVSIPMEIIESFGLTNHDPVFVTATVEGILIKKVRE